MKIMQELKKKKNKLKCLTSYRDTIIFQIPPLFVRQPVEETRTFFVARFEMVNVFPAQAFDRCENKLWNASAWLPEIHTVSTGSLIRHAYYRRFKKQSIKHDVASRCR